MCQIQKIDWSALSTSLGTVQEYGEQGGTAAGRQALELILGKDNIQLAVDHYLDGKPGCLLVQNVFEVIRPSSAMDYCFQIYQESKDQERKYRALILLKAFADGHVLPWLHVMLEANDPISQKLGSEILEQLIWSYAIEASACEDLLLKMKNHNNEAIKSLYFCILETLREREECF